MGTENQGNGQPEQKEPTEVGKKVHQTHFSVPETHFKDDSQDSEYEWVNSGPGRLKRVLKTPKPVVIPKK